MHYYGNSGAVFNLDPHQEDIALAAKLVSLLRRKPVVCGVTNLEYDHVEVLGKTLSEIAWHKAGIFKVSYVLVTLQKN